MLRARLGLLLAVTALGGLGAIAACGSDDDHEEAATDGGGDDVSVDAAPIEAGPATDGAACDLGVGALVFDQLLDSQRDGGAGACLQCVRRRCEASISACLASCECQAAVASTFQCFLAEHDLSSCAGPILGGGGEATTFGLGLFLCVDARCLDVCAPPERDAGSEDASSDAGTDAAQDAGESDADPSDG